MLKKTILVFGLCLSCLVAAQPVAAQEAATIVMRSGDRISGELVDLGGIGFTIRVNGQDRQIDPGQVAIVEFSGASADALNRVRSASGRPHIVLRNGDVIEGRLYDIGGTHPLRVTVDTPNGQRDFTSNDVAQIHYVNSLGASPEAVATSGQNSVAPGDIRVDANRQWTDTGITVRRGERWLFNSTGNVMLAEGISAGVNGTTAVSSANYTARGVPAGTLIGRVGNSAPFVIGSQTELTMPANGRLMLGVNDDHYQDNTGYFTVGVARAPNQR
jgi:hypothetical protein